MQFRGPYITIVAGLAAAAVVGVMSNNAVADQEQRLAAVQAANNTPAGAAEPTGAPDQGTPTDQGNPPDQGTPPSDANPPAGQQTTAPPKAKARKAVYAGSVEGGEASIAVSVKNDKAIAYVCDGKRLEAWLSGTVRGNQVTLSGEGGAKLNAEIQGNRLAGTIEAKNKSYDFDIKTVKKPSGLYQAAATVRGARVVGSWIVLPDGTQVGVVATDGEPGPAPEFRVEDGSVDVEGGNLLVLPVGPGGDTEE